MVDKCPRCNKSVYHAEKVLGGGHAWHKNCFKCPECNKRLDSANLAIHESMAYCKACHGRLFGPKGYGFGQGAGTLSMDHTSPTAAKPKLAPPAFNGGGSSGGGGGGGALSKFCGECGVKAEGGKFCHECGAQQGSSRSSTPVSSGPPSPPASAAPRPSAASRGFGGGGVKKPMGGGRDACGKCGKTVYHAEKAIGAGQVWHKTCFKCDSCRRKLDSTSLREHEGTLYCSACHGANFGPKGYGFGGGAGALARTQ